MRLEKLYKEGMIFFVIKIYKNLFIFFLFGVLLSIEKYKYVNVCRCNYL